MGRSYPSITPRERHALERWLLRRAKGHTGPPPFYAKVALRKAAEQQMIQREQRGESRWEKV